MRTRGFTYIEVIVSLFLVMASIAVVAVTLPASTAARGKSTLLDKAMALAQKELEKVRGAGYANITATQLYSIGAIDSAAPTQSTSTIGLSPVSAGTETIAGSTYSFTSADAAAQDSPAIVLPSGIGRITVEQVDTDVRRLTVTVSWSDRGVTRSFSTGTIICNL